jgi:hypothetical protein
MNSPFLVQNIIGLILLAVVFAGSIYLLLSKKTSNFLCHRSKILLVLYRVATTVVFSVSIIGFLCGIWIFYVIEFDDVSRDCWKRSSDWQAVVPGMSHEEAVKILGKPILKSQSEVGERATYCLNPIGELNSGTIVFGGKATGGEMRVLEKTPNDQVVLENLQGWIPAKSSKTYANYAGIISNSSSFWAFYGLLGLAILSLYPFNLRELSGLRMIYAPLAGGVFKIIYESQQSAGWQFELFSVSPLLTLILIGWIVRMGLILGPD